MFNLKRSDAQSLLFKPGIVFSYSKVTSDIGSTNYLEIFDKSTIYHPLSFRSYEYMTKPIKNKFLVSYSYQQVTTAVGYRVSYTTNTGSRQTPSINIGVAHNDFVVKGFYQLNKSNITKLYFHTGLGLGYTKDKTLEVAWLNQPGFIEVKDYKVNTNLFATFHTGFSLFTRADDRVDIGIFIDYSKVSIQNLANVNMNVRYGKTNQIHINGSGSYVATLLCIKYNFQKRNEQ